MKAHEAERLVGDRLNSSQVQGEVDRHPEHHKLIEVPYLLIPEAHRYVMAPDPENSPEGLIDPGFALRRTLLCRALRILPRSHRSSPQPSDLSSPRFARESSSIGSPSESLNPR